MGHISIPYEFKGLFKTTLYDKPNRMVEESKVPSVLGTGTISLFIGDTGDRVTNFLKSMIHMTNYGLICPPSCPCPWFTLKLSLLPLSGYPPTYIPPLLP